VVDDRDGLVIYDFQNETIWSKHATDKQFYGLCLMKKNNIVVLTIGEMRNVCKIKLS